MKRPNEFSEKVDVETWVIQLEIYLEKCVDRREWFDVTLSHINANCLKDLTIAELRYKQNNYQLLKEFLVKKYTSKSNIKNLELTDFVNRKQHPNESVKDYAEALQKIARDVLSSTPPSSVDEHLKSSLIKGLQNVELRSCAIIKVCKIEAKKETINFANLIEYLQGKEKA